MMLPAPQRQPDAPWLRAILGPLWAAVVRGVLETRAYDQGLGVVLWLLRTTDHHRAILGDQEWEQFQVRLHLFALSLLDRADRWTEYLETWNRLRAETRHAIPYATASLTAHGAALLPYLLERGPRISRVHFLYLHHHRHARIREKIAGRRRTRHASPARLSETEIARRLAAIREQIPRPNALRGALKTVGGFVGGFWELPSKSWQTVPRASSDKSAETLIPASEWAGEG